MKRQEQEASAVSRKERVTLVSPANCPCYCLLFFRNPLRLARKLAGNLKPQTFCKMALGEHYFTVQKITAAHKLNESVVPL